MAGVPSAVNLPEKKHLNKYTSYHNNLPINTHYLKVKDKEIIGAQ